VLYRAELLPESNSRSRDPGTSDPTDREGFEPSRAINPTRFPIVLLKPLGHLSSTCPRGPGGRPASSERRGWDSNPREPFGPDGLANRCRNHLATPPYPSRASARPSSCPSWARTRTLLIQSQTCCQLHQGASVHHVHRAGDGVRTRDPQLGKLMLYQLSYSRWEQPGSGSRSGIGRFKYTLSHTHLPITLPLPTPTTILLCREPPVRIELTTARLRIECSTSELRWQPIPSRRVCQRLDHRHVSGAEGSRTPYLCSAIAALYQMSYSPAYPPPAPRHAAARPTTHTLRRDGG
jgi:hypothetical protein